MRYLSRFELIYVRDKRSKILSKVHNKNSYLISDLVFEKKYWLNSTIKVEKDTDLITFIVRDWKFFDNNLKNEIILAKDLSKEGKKVVFMLFNPQVDKRCKEIIKSETNFEILEYNEYNMQITLEFLKKSSLVVTQRAHGAIIASILGTPAICLGIEQKLKNVHLMLKNSSLYFSYPLNFKKIKETILDEDTIKKLQYNIISDVKKNSIKIDNLVKSLKNYFKKQIV